MKRLFYFMVVLLTVIACSSNTKTKPITQQDYLVLLKDSCHQLKAQLDSTTTLARTYESGLIAQQNEIISQENQIAILQDSIYRQSLKIMKKSQFIELYKYKRLLKYYNLCKKKPDYWKYYKGWSIRVFELENKNYKPTEYVPDISELEGVR